MLRLRVKKTFPFARDNVSSIVLLKTAAATFSLSEKREHLREHFISVPNLSVNPCQKRWSRRTEEFGEREILLGCPRCWSRRSEQECSHGGQAQDHDDAGDPAHGHNQPEGIGKHPNRDRGDSQAEEEQGVVGPKHVAALLGGNERTHQGQGPQSR